jgi:hypothetical protein
MPNNPKTFPVFHVSELKRFILNDPSLFPSRQSSHPGLVISELGEEEWKIEEIIDKCRHGQGLQYLVKWSGYGDEENLWLPRRKFENCEALDRWEKAKVNGKDQ